MHYNLKAQMEKIGGNVVTQVEISGVGRAGHKRFVSENFDAALVALKAGHDELLGSLTDFHKPAHETTQADVDKASGKKVAKKPKKKPKTEPRRRGVLAKVKDALAGK